MYKYEVVFSVRGEAKRREVQAASFMEAAGNFMDTEILFEEILSLTRRPNHVTKVVEENGRLTPVSVHALVGVPISRWPLCNCLKDD